MGSVNPSQDQIAAMLASAGEAGAIQMINLLRFRARADYPADHACAGEELTGEAAYQRYMAGTVPHIAAVGARVLWAGSPNLVLIGPTEERWDLAFIVEYPNVAAMLKMLSNGDYLQVAVHRTAALEDSRLIRCAPRAMG
jgi:uncharacterized protein (DUF1330 family)